MTTRNEFRPAATEIVMTEWSNNELRLRLGNTYLAIGTYKTYADAMHHETMLLDALAFLTTPELEDDI